MKGSAKSKPVAGLAVLLACLFTTLTWAQTVDSGYNYPGGVAEILLEKTSGELPEIKYGIRDPATMDLGNRWRVLLGIELDTLPGEYVVYVKSAAQDSPAVTEKFSVEQHVYPIKVASAQLPDRLEHDLFSDLDYKNSNQPELPLLYPVDLIDQWSNDFGHLVESVDSESLIAQNYISLTTTAVAMVLAPQNAIVSRVIIHENQYATVFLDHGRGLYSIISGIDDLSIETGNGVVAGAVLGKLPGNSSFDNPHTITWQCVLNSVYVNPIILTKL